MKQLRCYAFKCNPSKNVVTFPLYLSPQKFLLLFFLMDPSSLFLNVTNHNSVVVGRTSETLKEKFGVSWQKGEYWQVC